MSLAACWEDAAPGWPTEVARAFGAADELPDLQVVFAIPEFQVPLPGGTRASQTDLMVLARNDRATVVVGVEGKVEEPFGPAVGEKRRDSSAGQVERLRFLETTLRLEAPCADLIRYQLLHRAASVLLVAEEVHASMAVLIVHSFSPSDSWFDDFAAFAALVGASVEKGKVIRAAAPTAVPLFLGWVTGDPKYASVNVPAAASWLAGPP